VEEMRYEKRVKSKGKREMRNREKGEKNERA
jgi:hypothetical protein